MKAARIEEGCSYENNATVLLMANRPCSYGKIVSFVLFVTDRAVKPARGVH